MTEEPKANEVCHTVTEYILWKLDRTIAILGLIVLGSWGLYKATPESIQIGIAVVGGLVGYIGGRAGSK